MKPKLSILDPNPTPLQYLSGLSQELFREIYIKRDDLMPFGGGGNKLRKLEYLMIEALNSQATTIVTVGAPQTNHGRLTAAVAAKFGLKCIIVAVGDTEGELSGNLLLDGIFGARVVLKHDDGRDHDVQLGTWTVPANSTPRLRNSKSMGRRSMSLSAVWVHILACTAA